MAEYKTLTLSQCAHFDKENGAKYKLTGWGKVCAERTNKGISRKDRRLRNKVLYGDKAQSALQNHPRSSRA